MNLKELEARLQALIEVDLLKILPSRKVEDVIVQKLAAAIQLNTTSEPLDSLSSAYRTLLYHAHSRVRSFGGQFEPRYIFRAGRLDQ